MRLHRLLLALFLIGGIHLATALPARACSCVSPTQGADAGYLENASAVFVGDLVRYAAPPQRATMTSMDPAIWTFRVSGVYKGEVAATQDIVSPFSGASCGLEFAHAGIFLIYAFNEPQFSETRVRGPVLYSSLCNGSRSTADAPIPSVLGDPRPALPETRAADVPKPTSPSASADPSPTESGTPIAAGPGSGADWATVATWSTGVLALTLVGFVGVKRATASSESD